MLALTDGALLGEHNPYHTTGGGDSDEEELYDASINDSISELMTNVANLSDHEYQLGLSLVFIRSTKTMTMLDQLMSVRFDEGAALAEALGWCNGQGSCCVLPRPVCGYA